jgi:hypothetical protein
MQTYDLDSDYKFSGRSSSVGNNNINNKMWDIICS